MNIKGVDFPEPLLNALRDGRLVVFAGAGVSMGPPAKLPNFRKLAERVAEGTSQSIKKSETDDQFLGRLKDRGVQVHQRAAQILQPDNLEPNVLHQNLLRLFKKTGPVRIVTTNFDCLFEEAAKAGDLFQTRPKVFEAPVLPLGSRFQGIVHLHGSVNEPEEMVLTHRDFGRAYLTEEDGWARRFLVSLFAHHTVLFVGYSHNDTIMTYLTPSLPPDGTEERFALVGSESGDLDRWRRMGIKPIVFDQNNKHDFAGLDTGVEGLADFERRSLLGWQQEITTIARGNPPNIKNEESDMIEYVLTRKDLTNFFVQDDTSPDWIEWLDCKFYFNQLFREGKLEGQDRILSQWFATQFARECLDEETPENLQGFNPNSPCSIICNYNGKLNSHLWTEIVLEINNNEEKPLNPKMLSRCVHILMNSIPMNVDEFYLLSLAKNCANAEAFVSLLQVYDAITERLVFFLPYSEYTGYFQDYEMIKELWEQCLKPNLNHIGSTLLERTTMRLEQRYSAIIAWNEGEQNEQLDRIDILIDVTRDCLEWLATRDLNAARSWCERFANADAPLLQRLAIHTVSTSLNLSANQKIAWLLENCDFNKVIAHHEALKMVTGIYSQSSNEKKASIIQKISIYRSSIEEYSINSQLLVYYCFKWLHQLHQIDLNCQLVQTELDALKAQHPDFQFSEQLYPAHSLEVHITRSPWSKEQLLEKDASKWLPQLLSYQSESILLSRDSMLIVVNEAAQGSPDWGLALADSLVSKAQWESDLWPRIISAWETAELNQNHMEQVVCYLSNNQLYRNNINIISDTLKKLIQCEDTEIFNQRLGKLYNIANSLYDYARNTNVILPSAPEIEITLSEMSWYSDAINHPSGKLAEFWIYSIEHWRTQQEMPQQVLTQHKQALDTIIQDDSIAGQLGRTILASQLHFLYQVDSVWTEQHLLPLFDANHQDFPCAWDGFLTYDQQNPQILELLQEKFIGAIQKSIHDFPIDRLKRFISYYTIVMCQIINNTNNNWINKFFEYANDKYKVKQEFAVQIRNQLRNLDESQQQEWWNVWIKDYWENRLHGVPSALEDGEIAVMHEWVIHLPGVFREAVDMAMNMRTVTLPSYSRLLRQIGESNLVEDYPSELAKFLIHLGQADPLPHFWKHDLNVLDTLRTKPLPGELDGELSELMLRLRTLSQRGP